MLDTDPVEVKLCHSFAVDSLEQQGVAEDAVVETREAWEADIELGHRRIDGLPVRGKAWH
jgi:hypothetical protein